MSDAAEEDATDIRNLIAERDELLQKLQEETEEQEQISQERDELLAASTGSDNMVQLKDAFSEMAAEKEMLENELQEARVVHNLLRASSRSSKVIPNALGLDGTNNEVLVRRISSIKPESIPVEARASKRSTILVAKMRTSTILPEQGLGNGAPLRQVSALGPGITAGIVSVGGSSRMVPAVGTGLTSRLSRRSSTVMISRRPSIAVSTDQLQKVEFLSKRLSSSKPHMPMAEEPALGTSRRSSIVRGTALMPHHQLQKNLEVIKGQRREESAMRNNLLASNSAGSSSDMDCMRMPEFMEIEPLELSDEGLPLNIRSSYNSERLANLKERVHMLESEREREQVAAFACMKSNDIRDNEMLSRIQQQLESALQQVHEDYRLLSQETMQMYTSPDKKQKKKYCPRDLRDLENDIDRKQHDLDFAAFSMQKTIDNCGKTRSTHEKQHTTDPSASQLQGNTSVEFTHFKVRTPVGAPSEIVTFGTSGTLGPQLTGIGHQVRQNLPQIVLQELSKIVLANVVDAKDEEVQPPHKEAGMLKIQSFPCTDGEHGKQYAKGIEWFLPFP
ncbi:unnamed protein product [Sphagnum troendelagicum]|uniref:Uncharacterized protein n=1 Tax=Sphagnum troendelagicum TaxID=128251 RepID=A0ABP0TJC7_9BRYO